MKSRWTKRIRLATAPEENTTPLRITPADLPSSTEAPMPGLLLPMMPTEQGLLATKSSLKWVSPS